MAGKQTLLGLVYLWTETNTKEENKNMVECTASDIDELGKGCETIKLGDMNAHTGGMDGYTDLTDNMLLDMCERQELVVCNSTEKYDGTVILEVRDLH